MSPNRNEPFSAPTNPVAGVRKPKTCGIASTKIIRMTRNFWVPWYTLLSSSSWRSRLMIFAPAKSCMMIDAVTIGPIPRCMSEPWAPREDGPEAREEVDDVGAVQAVDEDVCHGEVKDQDREDPEHLRPEVHVAFRSSDRRQAVRERFQSVQTAFLLLFEGHRPTSRRPLGGRPRRQRRRPSRRPPERPSRR